MIKGMVKRRRKNLGAKLGVLIITLVLVAFGLSLTNKNSPGESGLVQINTPTQKSSKVVTLSAVGDMLPHETVTNAAKSSSGSDYDYLSLISPELKSEFLSADLRFCNQEATSADQLGIRGYPSFNAPQEFSTDLGEFGCNLVSLANNHMADNGSAGIDGTLDSWDKVPNVLYSGSNRTLEEAEQLKVKEVKGIKFGFTAFTDHTNSQISLAFKLNQAQDYKLLDQQVKGLRAISDVVIVSIHWGKEDSHDVSTSQQELAQMISNLGADIIIGTGPHVWQPYQVLTSSSGRKTHLWNSIGNGLNSQTKPSQLFSGIAKLNISKEPNGKILVSLPEVLPTYMHYIWSSGVGLSDPQLLGRRDLKWTLLSEASELLPKRNDFETTIEEQKELLKSYINNPEVKIL